MAKAKKKEKLTLEEKLERALVPVEEQPYQVPENWCWARLEDLYIINPKISAFGDVEAAFIPMEKISAGFERFFSFEIHFPFLKFCLIK